MYGGGASASLSALEDLPVEDLKEIKLTPATATVKAQHNESWVGEAKEQLVLAE